MIDIDKLNDDVMSDIANNMQLDLGEDSTAERIKELTFEEAWCKFCEWNGLLGSFHISLREAYENLKAAEIKDPDPSI